MRSIRTAALIAAAMLGGMAITSTAHASTSASAGGPGGTGAASGGVAGSSTGGTGLLCVLFAGILADDLNGSGDSATTGGASCGGSGVVATAGAGGTAVAGAAGAAGSSSASAGGTSTMTVSRSGGTHKPSRCTVKGGAGTTSGSGRSGGSFHHDRFHDSRGGCAATKG